MCDVDKPRAALAFVLASHVNRLNYVRQGDVLDLQHGIAYSAGDRGFDSSFRDVSSKGSQTKDFIPSRNHQASR